MSSFQLHLSTWTKTNIEYQIKDICYENGYYYCITKADKGNLIYYSTDFDTWSLPEFTSELEYTQKDGIASICYSSDLDAFAFSTTRLIDKNILYFLAYSTRLIILLLVCLK